MFNIFTGEMLTLSCKCKIPPKGLDCRIFSVDMKWASQRDLLNWSDVVFCFV